MQTRHMSSLCDGWPRTAALRRECGAPGLKRRPPFAQPLPQPLEPVEFSFSFIASLKPSVNIAIASPGPSFVENDW